MDTLDLQLQFLLEAEQFANVEIRPFASQFEENECLPKELIKKMAEKGYLGSCFPQKYGGQGLNAVNYGRLTEIIGKADPSVRGLLTVNTSLIGEAIIKFGTEDQKDKWLPAISKGERIGAFALTEPEVGSDARNIKTSYKKIGSKYVLNGKKKWITLGDIADFFIVIASNGSSVTAFIVERENGVITKPIKGLLAGRAAHVAEVELNNVEVGEESILGKEGNGFSYIVSTSLDYGRYSIAWAGLAIAQEALDAMVLYARDRIQFGKKIYTYQLIQKIIADSLTDIHAARALCINAGEMRDQRAHDAIMQTTIAKYFTSKIAMTIAVDAVQLHGGNGCCNKYPVERLFREAKILEIIEGSSQMQVEIISKYGLRKYYKI
ncbi:MAG: acyl-CoA dehydrogenase [Bacteroidales bacterium]|nr:acyl-CoA dehydrogenase [Bacteroidales bacterium]